MNGPVAARPENRAADGLRISEAGYKMKDTYMRISVPSAVIAFVAAIMVAGCTGNEKKENAKPYTLDTCAVCDMKFADMGKPYTFIYEGREIKVCDKGEAADFKKDPAKYLKKIEEAEAKAQK